MIKILSAKNGLPTLSKDNKFLMSRYKPEKDAERQIPDVDTKRFYILFSAALGHLPRRLIDLGVSPSNILILEPDRDLENHTLRSEFAKCLIRDISKLDKMLEEKILSHLQPEIIVLPSFAQAFPVAYKEFETLIKSELKKATENIKVNLYFTKNWFLNLYRNTRWLQNSERAAILDFKDFPITERPVFVIASGVSLNEHVSLLKEIQSKFPILSVFSATRTLIAHGIKPDALVITDAGPANLLHANRIPSDIPILSGIYAHHGTLRSLSNPVLFFNAVSEIQSPSFEVSYPTVTLEAGMLAKSLSGKDPIFVGFDLSYPLSGSSHSKGNALYDLRSYLYNRFFTAENLTQAFFKRSDLIIENRRVTHSQFLGIRQQAETLFKEAAYLPGGITFKNLKILTKKELPFFQTDKSFQSELMKLFLSNSVLKPRLPDLTDPLVQDKIFIREKLGGYFDPKMLHYFSRKL